MPIALFLLNGKLQAPAFVNRVAGNGIAIACVCDDGFTTADNRNGMIVNVHFGFDGVTFLCNRAYFNVYPIFVG